ncbi:hypothetical protein [Frigoribacterium sp. CG_9.8]|uniref:hypothetical protein n=1 Tax=Frigoribacterium sp. CG_9.8 TaxID=2787733 RepID=UPI0018CA6CD7|nr:hypothetical protein [Frigoribacterium sp. CG_9.8]MBG6107945.1 type II secretory pathway pseudopilin PulG [Frigoribacterium sp. CG_9.8]
MTSPTDRDTAAGFTLVEVLLYSLLLIVILAVVGSMLLTTTTTSKTVNSVTDAATSAQIASESVGRGIRNSSDFFLTTPVGADQLLRARTARGGATVSWVCMAWYYSAAGGGTIRTTTSATAISATPTAATLAQWTLLDTGVAPASGAAIFSADDAVLTVAFTGIAANQSVVSISNSAYSRAGATGVPSCY